MERGRKSDREKETEGKREGDIMMERMRQPMSPLLKTECA